MKILLDMNISPEWVEPIKEAGIECVHWSSVGDIRSPDHVIFDWARENGSIVMTFDLDFGSN